MKRNRVLSCLITLLLIAVVDSTEENTVMRLEMTHVDTLRPRCFHRIVSEDQKRHSLISLRRKLRGRGVGRVAGRGVGRGGGGGGGVSMPLGSGVDYGAAQYFTEISVGTPSKLFKVLIDTGSDMTWVHCRYRGKGNIRVENRSVFEGEGSKSFTPIGCLTQTCKKDLSKLFSLNVCPTPSTPCSYDYEYAGGSSAQGIFARETVTAGLTNGRKTRLHNFVIGCTNSFTGNSFHGTDGVLGLANSDISFTSKATAQLGRKFSYCLVDHLSSKNVSNFITFGASPTQTAPTRRITTPIDLDINPPFYAVDVIGISLGNVMLKIPIQAWNVQEEGGSIVDSGCSLTLLAEVVYKAVVSGLERHLVGFKRVKPEGIPIEYCYDTAKGYDESKIPQLAFHFKGGTRFEPHRKSYLVDTDPGVRCLGFVNAGTPATNVIGNIMQQNFLWEFDLAASSMSFSPSTCT